MDQRPVLAETMRNAVADPARPANDEDGLTGEVERIGHAVLLLRSNG
ncbi:MAG: hypothetical protein ACJA1G_001274 [Qipengyuania sp.]|jgi:hypothetical protein